MIAVETVAAQSVVSQHFPLRRNIGIVCWSIPDQAGGFLSQIVVFATDLNGNSKMLWQSPLDNSYSAQIHFLSEITVQGLPLALVQRETGAASSELDAIGKAAGHFRCCSMQMASNLTSRLLTAADGLSSSFTAMLVFSTCLSCIAGTAAAFGKTAPRTLAIIANFSRGIEKHSQAMRARRCLFVWPVSQCWPATVRRRRKFSAARSRGNAAKDAMQIRERCAKSTERCAA